MKKRLVAIIVVTGSILIGTCFQFGNVLPQPVAVLSQDDGDIDGADFLLWQRTLGIAPAQVARITVANLTSGRSGQPLTFRCAVFDRNGTRVFTSAPVEVPAGRFGQVDVSYGELEMDFEAGTGRKQTSLTLALSDLLISNYQSGGSDSAGFVGSLELIDLASGNTTIYQTIRLQDLSKAR